MSTNEGGLIKRAFYKFFYDIELSKPASKRVIEAQKREQEQIDQIKSSIDILIETRLNLLKESASILVQLSELVNFYKNNDLTNLYNSLCFYQNLFEENEELDINILTDTHTFHTKMLIELLVKNTSNFDKKIEYLKQKIELELKHKTNTDSKLSALKSNIDLVTKNNYSNKYTDMIIQYLKLFTKFDERASRFFDNSFTSFIKLNPFDLSLINNETHTDNFLKLMVYRDKFTSFKEFSVSESLIETLISSEFDINYSFTIKSAKNHYVFFKFCDLEITYMVLDSNSKKFFIIESDMFDNICNDEYTSLKNYNEELKTIEFNISKLELELASKNTLQPEVVELILDFKSKVDDTEFVNDEKNINLEVRQLRDLLELNVIKK